MKYAIIGGTGFEKPFLYSKKISVQTPYGKTEILEPKDKNYYFLSRHGEKHSIAPHKINYRANIWALKELGVEYIYGLCAVGSIQEKYQPGSILLLKDFLDFTKSRISTFYDGEKLPLKHLEMTDPYSPILNHEFQQAFPRTIEEAIYVATEGPRFETAAEIKLFSLIGGDVVGMTNVPEVILARELEIEYAAICTVTNLCTGLVKYVSEESINSTKTLNHNLILETIDSIFSKKSLLDKRSISNFC